MLSLHRSVVDGIPVFSIPEASAPFTAALVFRVGQVDETLATRGITHVVEHLAMSTLDDPPFEHNAFVDLDTTVFYASGPRTAVSGYLHDVCRALGDLPLARLPIERKVLLTEAAGGGGGTAGEALSLRYGAVSYGLAGWPDLGLASVDADAVMAWAARCFTAGNAAVWVAGEVPDDLRLPLPGGSALPLPRIRPVATTFPAVADAPCDGVTLTVVAPRSDAISAAFGILHRRLRRTLRHDRGLSYDIDGGVDDLHGARVHVGVTADATADQVGALRDAFLEVVGELADVGPTAGEVAREVDDVRTAAEDPAAAAEFGDSAASRHLLGLPVRSPAEIVAAYEALTPAAVADAFRATRDSWLLLCAHDDAPEGFTCLGDAPSPPPAEGRRYKPRFAARLGGGRGLSLVVGDEAVMMTFGDGGVARVTYADAVALASWDDGARLLYGADGDVIPLVAEMWRGGDEALRRVEAAVDPAIRITGEGVLPSPVAD